MTGEERKILVDKLDKIVFSATAAKRCLLGGEDEEAKSHMIRVESQATFLHTIRERQRQ